MYFKVIFNIDGTGVYYDPYEPIHLDAILAYALAPFHTDGAMSPSRDEKPIEIPIPLMRWHIDDQWGWKASALFPDDDTNSSLQYYRKKFNQDRIELTTGSPHLQMGPYKENNNPMPLLLCHKLIAYGDGNRAEVLKVLKKHVKYLGKHRACGKGRIMSIETEVVDDDYSMIRDGKAMRVLPQDGGIRLCRVRPPYWNIMDRVECCEIGDEYVL